MPSAFESIMSRRRDGDGRRGVIVLVAALLVFVAVLMFSSSSSYGATEAKPAQKAAKKPTKKPKVKASIRRGQLNVLGTKGNDRITLRLKPGDKSRLQVDVGSNGSAEFTFRRKAFNRIVVHAGTGADALSINERFGVFVKTEATTLFGDAGKRPRRLQRLVRRGEVRHSRATFRGCASPATGTRSAQRSSGSTYWLSAARTT